jgi:threonylcarbamoyladenosine tRNA methylthiotransferase MtaB
VMQSINEIVDQGVKEVVLTGINIGDFGKHNNLKFIDLLREIEEQSIIERVRISSIEPDLLSDDIIKLVSKSGKLMPHFHIPLQSGNDKILKAMHRRYTTTLFTERIQTIKSLIPFCCVAADVIVGFPGESNDDFDETFHYIENSEISYVHVFPYSERSNTPSSKLMDSVPTAERKRRSNLLHILSENKKRQFYQQNKGKQHKVLFESEQHKGFIFGFTDNYIRVKMPYNAKLINQIIPVRLGEIDNNGVFIAELING